MLKNSVYSEIFEEYDRDRILAEKKAERLKIKLYEKVPRLREIEREISEKGVELFESVIHGSHPEKFDNFKNASNKLRQERQNILRTMGLKDDVLEPQYKCNICKDTGMIGTEKCSCFNKRLAEKYYQLSNLGDILKKENFDNFRYDIFSKNITGNGISSYDNIRNISAEAMMAVENFENKPLNMLFYGHSGLGKSYMCNCIAKALIDKGYFVIYMSAYRLFTTMTNVRFNNAANDEREAVKLLQECDLLVIDDLGTEGVNSSTNAEFFEILNSRLRADKSTLISANLSPTDINITYSERIFSRLVGSFKVFEFIGDDLRMH